MEEFQSHEIPDSDPAASRKSVEAGAAAAVGAGSAVTAHRGASDVGESGDSLAGQYGEREASEASLHVEYQSAISRLDAYGDTGRRDLMFVTAAQAAIISIVGDRLTSLGGVRDWALVGVAFAVSLLGCNSQWRLRGQVRAFMARARWIERRLGMALLRCGDTAFAERDESGRFTPAEEPGRPILKRMRPMPIGRAFAVLYGLIAIFWFVIIVANVGVIIGRSFR